MRIFLLASIAAIALTGCLYRQPVYQGNLMEKTKVEQLQAGMSKDQVAQLLGLPSIQDPFHHSRWDYASTERVGRTGKTQIKNFTVYFENDLVTKWDGNYFAEQDEQLAKEANKRFGANLRKDKNKKNGGGGDSDSGE